MGMLIAITVFSSLAAWAVVSTVKDGQRLPFDWVAWTVMSVIMSSPFWIAWFALGGES